MKESMPFSTGCKIQVQLSLFLKPDPAKLGSQTWAHPGISSASKQIFAQVLMSPGSDRLCILTPFYSSRSFGLEILLAEEAFMQHVGHVIVIQKIFCSAQLFPMFLVENPVCNRLYTSFKMKTT